MSKWFIVSEFLFPRGRFIELVFQSHLLNVLKKQTEGNIFKCVLFDFAWCIDTCVHLL
jgi:hypothetical protein